MRKETLKMEANTIDKTYAVNLKKDGSLKILVQKIEQDEAISLNAWAVKGDKAYKPINMRISAMSRDIKKIADTGICLSLNEFSKCLEEIKEHLDEIPTIPGGETLGFQTVDGQLQFRGACDIDEAGKCYPSNQYEVSGMKDVQFMKSYAVNEKRQLLLLHTFAAPMIALYKELEENPMIFLYGESSTGKSTVARYLQSVAIERNERTVHSFNATSAGFMQSLGMNNGLPVCLDDTSAGDAEGTRGSLKNYQQLVYNLAAGKDKKRYKGRMDTRIKTSILITAENNDLLQVSPDLKGIYSRVFPMYIEKQDLFDNVAQVNRCKKTTSENVGVLYSCYVSELMRQGEEKVLDEVRKAKEAFEKKYSSENGIINRWCAYWGVLCVTGKMLEKVFGVACDVDAIAEYMKKELLFNLRIQNEDSTKTLILNDLYESISSSTVTLKDDTQKYVMVKKFNDCAMKLKINKRVAKDMLYHAGLIRLHDTNELTKNIGSGYGRCLLLAF